MEIRLDSLKQRKTEYDVRFVVHTCVIAKVHGKYFFVVFSINHFCNFCDAKHHRAVAGDWRILFVAAHLQGLRTDDPLSKGHSSSINQKLEP